MARVLGAKGLAGAMKVELLTDWPERLEVGAELYVEHEADSRRITDLELGGRVPAIRLEGIEDREAATGIVGRHLEVVARTLPEGSYYWHELVGLRVVDEAGSDIGRVAEIFRAGGNEVYRVTGPRGELLIPALRSTVARIDTEAGVMVVRLSEALPEEP